MNFETLKQIYVKTFRFQEKLMPGKYTVEVVITKKVTVVQLFFVLFVSVIQSIVTSVFSYEYPS